MPELTIENDRIKLSKEYLNFLFAKNKTWIQEYDNLIDSLKRKIPT